jgi:hypothetical protein
MKKNRGDESVGVTIHIYIYMEISQGNSLCSYLYLKQIKISFFFFLFFFHKVEQKGRAGPTWQGEGVLLPLGEGLVGKRARRVKMVQKMCTHVCKCKNDTC